MQRQSQKRAPKDLAQLKKAVEANPDVATAHLQLGTELLQRGSLAAAEEALQRAIELDPNLAGAWVNLGGVALARWDFDRCIEANTKAIEKDPSLTMAHYNRGLGHLYKNEPAEMLSCFDRVVELDPSNGGGHYHRAVALNALDRGDEAQMALDHAAELGYSPDPKLVRSIAKKMSTGGVATIELEPKKNKKH